MRNFEHTVDVLVKAYLNDTLVKADCQHCAVGNIVSEGNHHRFYDPKNYYESWYEACGLNAMRQDYRNPDHSDIVKTGYSLDELRRIEKTFMNTKANNGDEMFISLMAVVDVLAEIHGIDLTAKEQAKALFVKV